MGSDDLVGQMLEMLEKLRVLRVPTVLWGGIGRWELNLRSINEQIALKR